MSFIKLSNQRILNNFIDMNFQDMLFPLDLLMSILQIPKYKCSDGFITPSKRLQKLKILMMYISVLILLYFRFGLSLVGDSITSENFITLTLYFDVLYFSLALAVIFIGNIVNTYNSTNIVLNLQKAFRMFRFRFIDNSIRRLMFWNWMSLAILAVCYIILIGSVPPINIFALFLNFLPFIYLDASVLYITRVLCIIRDGSEMWTKELKRGIMHSDTPGLHKVLESFCLILDAFAMFKKVSSITIAFSIADIISHTLAFLQVTMDVKKQNAEISMAEFLLMNPMRISAMMWMTKNYLLLCIFCHALDQFYMHMRQAKEICCTVDTGIYDKDVKQLCKNVWRCTNARFGHLRVCGVQADARLPLRLAGVLATYIVVVLQFNL